MITCVDLFCGAGGTSTGILKAVQRLGRQVHLTAVNHWQTAVNTHSLNHPSVNHLCQDVETVHPMDLVTSGILDLLAASVECRFFSRARNHGPCDPQSRAQGWQIHRWATDLKVLNILMENVVEFMDWGPLHPRTRRPIKSRRGEYFRSFVETLRNIGYTVEWRKQVACDFGDRTSRERLILMARLGLPIHWPTPTHGPGRNHPHGSARECLNLSHLGSSIFNRKRPLRPKTLKRIEDGFIQFGGAAAKPFLLKLYGTGKCADIDRPMPTVTAGGNHLALVQPFMIHLTHDGKRRAHSIDDPMPTVTGANRGEIALVQPFLTSYYGNSLSTPISEPLPTVTTRDRFALVQPVETGAGIDILFRMVQPEELSASHSFPSTYQFTGNKAERVKQIGNSVPVELAAAHATAILS